MFMLNCVVLRKFNETEWEMVGQWYVDQLGTYKNVKKNLDPGKYKESWVPVNGKTLYEEFVVE